jgi:hypothetical protein
MAARWYTYFQTKNLKLGTFLRVLRWKMLVYFLDIWSILRTLDIFWTFDLFYGHLEYFMDIWYLYFVVTWEIFPFCYVVPRKIWQPCRALVNTKNDKSISSADLMSESGSSRCWQRTATTESPPWELMSAWVRLPTWSRFNESVSDVIYKRILWNSSL